MDKQEKWREGSDVDTEGVLERVAAMFPEPLYESAWLGEGRLCLVCGRNPAHTVLRTPTRPEAIVPLCQDCSVDWKFYGYEILKRIKPAALMLKVTRFFLGNPLRRWRVWDDVRQFNQWQKKMRKIRKQMRA